MSTSGDRPKIGSLLLKKKLLGAHDVDAILKAQREEPNERFLSLALRLGKLSTVDALTALSEQLELPAIDLEQIVLALDDLRLVPPALADKHSILVVALKDDEVIVAMADAGSQRIIGEMEYIVGKPVSAYLALAGPLRQVIADVYRKHARGDQLYTGKAVPAEHLAAMGIDPAQPVSIPPPPVAVVEAVQHGVVASTEFSKEEVDDFSFEGLFADEAVDKAPPPIPKPTMLPSPPVSQEPLPPALSKRPTLDRAFESRVGNMPDRPTLIPESTGAMVLVVDDDDDIRKLLARLLQERGYRVLEARRGADAVGLVREREPQIVLIDSTLPDMHAFDLCQRIKSSERYGHIPVIVLSAAHRGWRIGEDLKEATGIYSFIEKPFRVGDVVKQVQRCLAGHAPHSKSESEQMSEAAKECLERGLEAWKSGDLDKAIDIMRRGMSIDPDAYRLHYHLGLLYGRKEDKAFEAIESLERAVQLAPRSFSALKNLAVLYQRVSFRHKAVEMWERALVNAPDEETRQGIKAHVISLL